MGNYNKNSKTLNKKFNKPQRETPYVPTPMHMKHLETQCSCRPHLRVTSLYYEGIS